MEVKPANGGRDGGIHPTAVIDSSAKVDHDAEVGPHCHLEAGVSVGAGCRIAGRVTINRGASIGRDVAIGPGAFVQAGSVIGDRVEIGANSTVGADALRSSVGSGAAPPTVVREGVRIGANVTLVAGATIGRDAEIGAGSVVSRDVPPHATVVGNPGRIVGYKSQVASGATPEIRASTTSSVSFPLQVASATLYEYPQIDDLRGSLTFAEAPHQLPFVPTRYFVVFGVPSREVRGEHAHKELHELLICVSGDCAVALDDGVTRTEVVLDRPNIALHIPPMVWGTQYKYSADAVLVVLASHGYDDSDYIRDYDEFMELVSRG